MSRKRVVVGQRRISSTVSMPLDAWVSLDLMADEDNVHTGEVILRLINQEAKRRLEEGRRKRVPQEA